MTMELDFWIPNLSGEVATLSRLERHIEDCETEGYAISYTEGKISIKTGGDAKNIDPGFLMTIEVKDCHGRCHLACNREVDLVSIVMANKAWNIFRKMLDGCESTIYDCSAMRSPFNVFHDGLMNNSLHRRSGNYYVDIANRFIQSVEDVSDTMNHIWSDGPEIKNKKDNLKVAANSLANAEANELYFDSFMNLYRRKLPAGMYEAKTEEMGLRMRKVRIANDAIMTSRKNEYDLSMRTISKAALIVSFFVLTLEAAIGLNNIFHII